MGGQEIRNGRSKQRQHMIGLEYNLLNSIRHLNICKLKPTCLLILGFARFVRHEKGTLVQSLRKRSTHIPSVSHSNVLCPETRGALLKSIDALDRLIIQIEILPPYPKTFTLCKVDDNPHLASFTVLGYLAEAAGEGTGGTSSGMTSWLPS